MKIGHVRNFLETVPNIDDTIGVGQGEAFVSRGGVAHVGATEEFERKACGRRVVQFVTGPSCDTTAETNFLHVIAGKGGDGGGRDGSTGSEPQLAGVADWAAEKTGRVEDRETVI